MSTYTSFMLETSARLLRLLSLLQARRFWSGKQLAHELEVDGRTVRRDVDRLRQLGYPVHAAAGVAGGYQLGAGAALPPLLLDGDEALAVSLGLRSAASGSVKGLSEAALRALSKLEQVMPPQLRRRVKGLHAAIVPLSMAAPSVDAEVLTTLAAACRGQERVRFRYEDASGAKTQRHVEPLGLVHTGTRWYLVAWDLTREDFRTFRVDRVEQRPSVGTRFSPREVPGGDLAAFVSRSLSGEPYAQSATLLFRAPLSVVARRVPRTLGRLEAEGEEACLWRTVPLSPDSLLLHVGLLGLEFEVVDPPELKARLLELSDHLRRASRRRSKVRS